METLVDKEKLIQQITEFITSIGINVSEGEVPAKTFLPGLQILYGKLIYDRAKLLYPGDMLHEAGHIAVTKSSERSSLSDNVIDSKPEKAGDEMAVLLWTYAACCKIGLAPEVVFHQFGYKGQSEWLVSNFENKTYIGMPLLVWIGLADDAKSENGFPIMKKWLRD